MAAGALFFSVMSALVKEAGERLPTMEVVLARSLAVLALSAWALRGRRGGMWGTERKILVLRGVLGFIALSCFYYGVIHLPLADATVIQYTNPVFTGLMAVPLLGEGLRMTEVLLTLSSLAGVVLVARPSALFGGAASGLDPVAVLFALAGAVFSAAAYVTVRRLKREDPLVVVFWFALVSVVGAAPALGFGFVVPRGWDWGVLVALGVTTHLGQLFLTRGLQLERAGRATAVGYLQIVFAAAWGAAFFAEVPDAWSVAGAVVIVASTLLLGRLRPLGADPGGAVVDRPGGEGRRRGGA